MKVTEEREAKHSRLVAYLDSHDLDAVLLSRRCNFNWYTCGARNFVNTACDAGNSWLLVTRKSATVLTNNIEGPRLRAEEIANCQLPIANRTADLADGNSQFAIRNLQSVGPQIDVVEFPYFDPARRTDVFADAIGSARVACDAPVGWVQAPALSSDFDRLRWTLVDAEIERYRRLCDDVVSAVEYIARDARAGTTENEMAGMLSGALRVTGCLPWVLLVAADGRIAKFRHPLPTDQAARKRFLLVTTAERGGLLAACSRMVNFGRIDADLSRRHQAVAMVDAALIASTRVGKSMADIFVQGQEAYAAAGFPDEWRQHHQGGMIGYLPRELLALPHEQYVVQANQAFAWNPTIAGTKCEDTILCEDHQTELIAKPTDWPMIEATWKGVTLSRPAILER